MKVLFSGIIAVVIVFLFAGDLYAAAGEIGLPGFGRLILSFVVISGLIYTCVYFMKRFFMKSGGKGNGSLELISSLTLGQKSKICIVKAGKKAILIGVTGQQINTLSELEPDQLEKEEGNKSSTAPFVKYLRRSASKRDGGRTSATG